MAEKLNVDPIPMFEGLTPRAQSWLRKFIGDVGYWVNSRLLENEKIRWKTFSGTTDADSQTTFAHGLTESKITGALCVIKSTVFTDGNCLGDMGSGGWVAADAYRWYSDSGTFYIDNVGSRVQGQPYRVIIFYVD